MSDCVEPPSQADSLMKRRRQDQSRSPDDAMDTFAAPSMMAEILNPTPNYGTVPSGSSSPTANPSADDRFVSPKRPKSTPFPYPASDEYRPSKYDLDELERLFVADKDEETISDTTLLDSSDYIAAATTINILPVEIQEGVLDYLFGYRVSTTSISAMQISGWGATNLGTAMRHSRRRELTELALVSPTWRDLVQQRLYRHIKLKGTVDCLEDAMLHFARHEHLRPYVKHVEMWFPVFQPTYGCRPTAAGLSLPTVTMEGLTNATYTLPRNKCTLEEAFRFIATTLPRAQVVTLEGGERRKAPKVVHFPKSARAAVTDASSKLAALPNVKTLITRGQWNLMRDNSDFSTVLAAFPSLVRWHGSYSKPKSKSYITIAQFLPHLPPHISELKLCLESDYRRESATPTFFCKVAEKTHICSGLADSARSLEHFSYTGRMCHVLFDKLARLTDPYNTRLKTIDLTVKNCCRPIAWFHESGSGIQDMGFIDAFERLVLAAIRSLTVLKHVHYIRIRFVDLESVLPPLNPFFIMSNNECTGVWSGEILSEMNRVRPNVQWNELSDSFGNIVYNKEGRMVISPEEPGRKITSLKLSNYRMLSHRINIH
jgi:hypothetical protein